MKYLLAFFCILFFNIGWNFGDVFILENEPLEFWKIQLIVLLQISGALLVMILEYSFDID